VEDVRRQKPILTVCAAKADRTASSQTSLAGLAGEVEPRKMAMLGAVAASDVEVEV
jgi:hypothetical protein